MKAGLIANEADHGAVLGKAGDGGDVAVDAGEASVAVEGATIFGEKVVVCIADGHAVAEEDAEIAREVGGELEHGFRFERVGDRDGMR